MTDQASGQQYSSRDAPFHVNGVIIPKAVPPDPSLQCILRGASGAGSVLKFVLWGL